MRVKEARAWAVRALDLIAPRRCLGCERLLAGERAPFCMACVVRLPWWRRADGCPRCGWDSVLQRFEKSLSGHEMSACPGCYSQGGALHRCISLLRYDGDAKRAIRQFKSGRSALGPPLPARLATEFFADELGRLDAFSPSTDLVVPIPLYARRHRSRGFNQSALIAQRLARRAGMRCSVDALERWRATETQAHQRAEERRANLRQAFRVRKPEALTARIWLVDDVLTTGATLEAAAECLLEAGVDEVCALTVAATLPRPPRWHPGSQRSGLRKRAFPASAPYPSPTLIGA